MTTTGSKSSGFRLNRPAAAAMALTVLVLVLGLIPAAGGGWARSALRSMRALEPNRTDHERHAAGYYVGLIDGGPEAGRDELALRLLGKPPEWVNFNQVGATRYLPGDFFQFELLPNIHKTVFGAAFTTNAFGLRDRPCTKEKPGGVFRIALLGSSMDMGWGVGTDETYENQIEDWLNAHAAKHGLSRRFEVLNFAVAAYSPLHRLESFERKARAFQPDLVLYAATRLDPRLLEIHLCGLLQNRIDLKYDFLRRAVAEAGIGTADLVLDANGKLKKKEEIKARMRPKLWQIDEDAIAALAEECRASKVPLACLIIPRASESDGPDERAGDVARIRAIAGRHDLPVIDLSASFDDQDPEAIEIAPWDDHPNALGHHLLFLRFGHEVVNAPSVYRLIFGADPGELGVTPKD